MRPSWRRTRLGSCSSSSKREVLWASKQENVEANQGRRASSRKGEVMNIGSYLDRLAAMRTAIAEKNYEQALQIGRAEMDRGCDSSDLLLLLATAGQLSEGDSCSLDDVHGWLERATQLNPDNAEAWMELGHFLDAVADQPQLAVSAFENALEKSVAVLEATLDGLESTSSSQDEATRERLAHLCQRAGKRLSRTAPED